MEGDQSTAIALGDGGGERRIGRCLRWSAATPAERVDRLVLQQQHDLVRAGRDIGGDAPLPRERIGVGERARTERAGCGRVRGLGSRGMRQVYVRRRVNCGGAAPGGDRDAGDARA